MKIDWDLFDKPDDDPKDKPLGLHEIPLTLIGWPPERDYGKSNSGTLIRVYGGRDDFGWTETKLKEIGDAIAQLRSPYYLARQEMGFNPVFHCPQLSGEKFEVLTETIPAPFICTAIVDERGIAEIEIKFDPPSSLKKPFPSDIQQYSEVDLRRAPDDNQKYWNSSDSQSKLRSPECGPFTCEIKAWLRLNEWIDYADFRVFTEYLEDFGGIGIFRDGLSILPAQIASKDDWLRLSTRHIKKGSHISYYNMAGSVDLIQENTLYLVDRTSREGLLETRPFMDLGQLLRVIIFELDHYVQTKREKYNRLKEGERLSEAVLNKRVRVASNLIKTVSKEYDFKVDPWNLKEVIGETEKPNEVVATLQTTFEEARKEIGELREQTNALLEAAGYGIAIGVAIHEIEKVTSNLYFGLESLLKKASSLDKETFKKIDQLSNSANGLLNELKRIAPLRVTRLERPRKFSVRDSILAASGAFRLAWDDLDVSFIPPKKEDDFELYGSFGACSQVFANLFDNSTYWLEDY